MMAFHIFSTLLLTWLIFTQKYSSLKMQCHKLEIWVLFLYCSIQIPAVDLSWIAESFNMDLRAQENISLCKNFLTKFKFEPLEKQMWRNSPGDSCPCGFAFQGSCAAAGADTRDRMGSWVIPGSVEHPHQVWQSWAWREGTSFYSVGDKIQAQLIAQGVVAASSLPVSKVSFQLLSDYCSQKPILV